MKEGCRVTPGGGNPRESATEKSLPWCRATAFGASMVRVKRWGKSPPRPWQQGRHGKPHPEQCRIGALRGKVWPHAFGRSETSTGTLQPKGPGWQLDRPGNGSGRGMVIQGGQPPGQNPAYRPSAHLCPRPRPLLRLGLARGLASKPMAVRREMVNSLPNCF